MRNAVPGKANTSERSDAGVLYFAGFSRPMPFRRDSPISSIWCTPCTRRSADRVGHGLVANDGVPVLRVELTGYDCAAETIPILEHL